MTADSPAVLLRAAAGKVREAAENIGDISPGSWDYEFWTVAGLDGPEAVWLAMLTPAVGLALADWLDAIGPRFPDVLIEDWAEAKVLDREQRAALSLARLIVGSGP